MTDHNHFSFIGRLVRDSEIKYTRNGTPVVEFSIAVNEKFKEKEHVNFFEVMLWGNLGTVLEKYLTKGKQILVSGRIKQERWDYEGKSYSKVRFHASNVQLLGSKSEPTTANNNYPEPQDPWQEDTGQSGYGSEDDPPF